MRPVLSVSLWDEECIFHVNDNSIACSYFMLNTPLLYLIFRNGTSISNDQLINMLQFSLGKSASSRNLCLFHDSDQPMVISASASASASAPAPAPASP